MTFWENCTKADSIINVLDSRLPRQRMQILAALEDKQTFGEWIEPKTRAALYCKDQGVIIEVYDLRLEVMIESFFLCPQNKQHWEKQKTTNR